MTPAAITSVLNLSSAIYDLAQASEKVEWDVRHQVGATITRLLMVIDAQTGLPAVVASLSPAVMDELVETCTLGQERVYRHVHRDAPMADVATPEPQPEAAASDIDAELTALLAAVNEREDAAPAQGDEPASEPELRALGIPQGQRIALRDSGICDRNQLLALTWRELSDLPGVGLAGASIIRRKVASAGYALATEVQDQDDLVRHEPNCSTVGLRIHPDLRMRLNDLRIYDLDDLCRVGHAALASDLVIGDIGAACLAQKARNFGRELAA
jgi:hypothetical protein